MSRNHINKIREETKCLVFLTSCYLSIMTNMLFIDNSKPLVTKVLKCYKCAKESVKICSKYQFTKSKIKIWKTHFVCESWGHTTLHFTERKFLYNCRS